MFKVSSLLPKAIKKAGIAGQVKDTQVIKCFNDSRDRLLRPEVARKVRAMYIKNGVLNIASLSDSAVAELQQREDEIIREINKKIGDEIVKKIRCIT